MAGCEAAKAGRKLTASLIARPLWVNNTNGHKEEYAVGMRKHLRMLFGRGGCFLHCHGCGGLRWWLLNEVEAQVRHDFNSAAKPASTRDAPQPACSRYGGYGKVQQHLCGPSVWSGQHPPAGPMHSRLSVRPYETCRAGAKVRKVFILLNNQRARALTAELSCPPPA